MQRNRLCVPPWPNLIVKWKWNGQRPAELNPLCLRENAKYCLIRLLSLDQVIWNPAGEFKPMDFVVRLTYSSSRKQRVNIHLRSGLKFSGNLRGMIVYRLVWRIHWPPSTDDYLWSILYPCVLLIDLMTKGSSLKVIIINVTKLIGDLWCLFFFLITYLEKFLFDLGCIKYLKLLLMQVAKTWNLSTDHWSHCIITAVLKTA